MESPSEMIELHPTLHHWVANTSLQVLTDSKTLGWENASLFIERQEAILEETAVPYLDDDVFALLLEGSVRVHMRLHNGKTVDKHAGPQSLQLIPRHSEFTGYWDSSWTYALLRLNRQYISKTAAVIQRGDPEKTELLPAFYFNDPLLCHLGLELCREMQSANPLGPMYAEALTNSLTLYLLRHYSTGRVVHRLDKGSLSLRQMSTIDEYIHLHLDQKITLTDLADCLHLSVPHFERMFRATTHRAPYHYVLEIRLEKARLLLANSKLSLIEVALQCGFSNQSHFTTHFTKYSGVSPARFARGVRG